MGTLQIDLMKEKHLEGAARLLYQRYKIERLSVPFLPVNLKDIDLIITLLKNIFFKAPGVMAIENEKMVGFLMGHIFENFRGNNRGIYCPEWAHAALGKDRASIYNQMYKELSKVWVENGCFTHAISLFAHDKEGVNAWFKSGFGMEVVDALREVKDIKEYKNNDDVEIKPITVDNLDELLYLTERQDRCLAGAPTFIPLIQIKDRKYFEDWLLDSKHKIWMAYYKGEAAGYIKCLPSIESEGCYCVKDSKTISISGVFTKEKYRGLGIGKLLLRQVYKYAMGNDYDKCSVDFESCNYTGSTFCNSHFEPVCYSLVRKIDERAAWAGRNREKEFVF